VQGVDAHRPGQRRALVWCLGITLVATVGEAVGGWLTGSLMLLSDAAHMLSHSVALAVSYVAIVMANRPRTPRSHFGLFRAEILASLFNAIGLFALTGWVVYESIERLQSPVAVVGPAMVVVAIIGLLVNVVTAWILGRSGAEDLNTRSALLHMFGDMFSSVIIVAGGVVLILTGWSWIDPVLSLVVALVVLWWAVGLLRSSCSILLERAPEGLEPDDVRGAMGGLVGVRGVHDLHIWEITSGYVCLTAHVVVHDARVSETAVLRKSMCDLLWERFQVAHVTLQVEALANCPRN
jgi:cobalt-zinc-cadmium efflux system protein